MASYSRVRNPMSDSMPGFFSGYYLDGTKVYPGTGVFPNCANHQRAARISSAKVSAYTSCNMPGSDHFVATNVKYFIDHPNLQWTHVDFEDVRDTPGAILINTYYFLRFNLTSNGRSYQQIGFYYDPWTIAYYWGGKKTIDVKSGSFEILTCNN